MNRREQGEAERVPARRRGLGDLRDLFTGLRMAEGLLQCIKEGRRHCCCRLGEIVFDGLVDIAHRPLPKDDRFGAHSCPASCNRSRSLSK